jgi:hypothetical protein
VNPSSADATGDQVAATIRPMRTARLTSYPRPNRTMRAVK